MGIRSSGRTAPKAGDKIQRGTTTVAVVLLATMIFLAGLLALASRDLGAGVTLFLLFVAASAVGAALGFLFGLPRARVADLAPGPSESAEGAPKASTFYLTNSNLIKVSDWLTTIVIGLGLVNLGKVVPGLRSLSSALAAPLGGTAYAGAAGISVLVLGVLAGFILTYLWTSIRVRELLEEAERQSQQTVPELRNQTLGQARRLAGRSNVRLLVPDDAPDDAVVTRQALPPGTSVPPGTQVAVSTVEQPAPPVPPASSVAPVSPASPAASVGPALSAPPPSSAPPVSSASPASSASPVSSASPASSAPPVSSASPVSSAPTDSSVSPGSSASAASSVAPASPASQAQSESPAASVAEAPAVRDATPPNVTDGGQTIVLPRRENWSHREN